MATASDHTPVINCTPHDIHLYTEDGKTLARTFPKTTDIRLTEDRAAAPYVAGTALAGLPIVAAPRFTGIAGALPADPMAPILVSMPVGQWIQTHPDAWAGPVLGPDTGPAGVVRGPDGQIAGTKRLVMYKPATPRVEVAFRPVAM